MGSLKYYILLLVLPIILFTSVSNAYSYQNSRYGASVNFGNLSVSDPSGSTESKSKLFINGIMTLPMNRNYPNWRYWFDVSYTSFDLEPSITNLGQQVSSFSITSIAQKGFNVSSEFRPWIGLGLSLSLNDFENRFNIDRDGYIADHFSNRSETNLGAVFNVGLSLYPLKNGVFVGSNFSVFSPFDDGIELTKLSIFFLL
ncbi:MAG: hypothetical protein JKY67_10265 [Pseudomonadales bacterium]|nr:hypothetical protein [Pseudomonadales bacterium]